jgi:hypothetical protein
VNVGIVKKYGDFKLGGEQGLHNFPRTWGATGMQ